MKSLNWNHQWSLCLNQFLILRVPIKILGFFDHCNLPQKNSELLELIGQNQVSVVEYDQKDFISRVLLGELPVMNRYDMKFHDFYKCLQNEPDKKALLKCYEEMLPEVFVPELEKIFGISSLESIELEDHFKNFYYRFFYGVKGQETSPHFDWSAYNSILLQVFGSKEVLLVEPDYLHMIPLVQHYARFDYQELLSFLTERKIPFQTVVVGPGEGLYLPPYYLHAIKYISDTCSVSLRFLPSKKLESLHRRVSCQPSVAQIFSRLDLLVDKKSELDDIAFAKSFDGFREAVKFLYKNIFDRDPTFDKKIEHYDKAAFEYRRSFQFQLDEKVKRINLVKLGCAYFENL